MEYLGVVDTSYLDFYLLNGLMKKYSAPPDNSLPPEDPGAIKTSYYSYKGIITGSFRKKLL